MNPSFKLSLSLILAGLVISLATSCVQSKVISSPPHSPLIQQAEASNSQLVAWGHLTGTHAEQVNWVLLIDKEVINYLLSTPIHPMLLQKIGDNSSWSPYLLRRDDHFITSLQMKVGELREEISFSPNGLPILTEKNISDHLNLFEKLSMLHMNQDGFITTR